MQGQSKPLGGSAQLGRPPEDTDPNEEHEVQEGPEMDCLSVAYALGVFEGPEVEVEAQFDQVSNVVGLMIRGGGCHGYNGVNDSQGDGLFLIDWWILNPVGFELTGEALVDTGVRFGVRGFSGIW